MDNLKKAERVELVFRTLQQLYPTTPIPLDHSDPYTLLIAVLLSAQCTDERVNQVTPALFAAANTPQSMVKLSVETIRSIIRPCGLSPQKSAAIHRLSELLIEKHNAEVPQSFAELEALPGVGHKTASVVMAQAFGVPAFPVDTHIHRLAQRWGLTRGGNVSETERAGTSYIYSSFSMAVNTAPRAVVMVVFAHFAAVATRTVNTLKRSTSPNH